MGSSSGGGDGGAAERKQKEDTRQADAIARLNAAFGYGTKQAAPDRQNFSRVERVDPGGGFYENYAGAENGAVPGNSYREVFDQAGFDAASAQAAASGGDLPALAERKASYQKYANDAKQVQLADLGKQKEVARRDVNFDLARRGLTGGSRQIDTEQELSRQFNKGVLKAETNAQGVANQAEQADEKTRISLINGIRGGMDQADAVSGALNAMSNSAANAQNAARDQNVGSFFDELRAQSQRQQDGQAYQQAFNKYRAGGGSGGSFGGNLQSVN